MKTTFYVITVITCATFCKINMVSFFNWWQWATAGLIGLVIFGLDIMDKTKK